MLIRDQMKFTISPVFHSQDSRLLLLILFQFLIVIIDHRFKRTDRGRGIVLINRSEAWVSFQLSGHGGKIENEKDKATNVDIIDLFFILGLNLFKPVLLNKTHINVSFEFPAPLGMKVHAFVLEKRLPFSGVQNLQKFFLR